METIFLDLVDNRACLWEMGGEEKGIGHVRIIADSKGRPKRPIRIQSDPNGQHALFAAEVGDVVVHADHRQGDFYIEVMEVVSIRKEEAEIDLEPLHIFERGSWIPEFPVLFKEAVQAAKKKATCQQCCEPHFRKG